VVDQQGRLVGVAVATLRGANNIGLAVPGEELGRVLGGRVGEVRASARGGNAANAEVEVEVALIDPLRRVRSVSVNYLRSDLVRRFASRRASRRRPSSTNRICRRATRRKCA